MHTYDFHIGDYARDTAHLSLLEHGVYRLLLDRAYSDEAPLTTETPKLMRKLGAKTAAEQKAVETVLEEFFTKTPEGWTHKRVIKELEEARGRSLKSKYSQVLRWWRHNKWPNEPTLAAYMANPTSYHDPVTGHIRQPNEGNTVVSNRNSYQPPTANRQPPTAKDSTPIVPKGTNETDSLALSSSDPDESPTPAPPPSPAQKKKGVAAAAESIYAAYPRKIARDAALRAIRRRIEQGADPTQLLTATEAFHAATDRWPSDDRQFIPHPATWFNRGSYADDPREWQRAQPDQRGPAGENFADRCIDTAQQPTSLITPPPADLGRAMHALYGDDWQTWAPTWFQMTPGDRIAITEWLSQNPLAIPA